MKRSVLTFTALALVGFGLASCGKAQRAERAAWRDQDEAACLASGQVRNSPQITIRNQPLEGAGTCGMNRPLKVQAFAGGAVTLSSAATLACPMVPKTDTWLNSVVQPAAQNVLGAQVIEIRAGSYSCRAMNNGSGTSRRSEHSYGNALDVFSFRLNDGRTITVKDGWKGSPEEQNFLREIFVGACEHFSTVLGPGSDMFHYDHFHLDLARHNGGKHICRPVIKYTPRYDLPPPDPARPTRSAELAPGPNVPPGVTAFLGGQGGLRPSGSVGNGTQVASNQFSPATPRYNTPPPLPSAQRGPLVLPGSVPPTEEVIVGDDEQGVLDGPEEGQPLITPQNDPFAYKPKR
jgi:Extensin-like protein C-terminus